jgi:hypothetical protein
MDLEQFANAGEFLGGIGVIVSLVYLASQIRGSTRSQRAENYGRSLEQLANMQARFATDDAFADLYNRGLMRPAELSVGERMKFTWACTEMFGYFEFMHHQHLQGDMPEEIHHRWLETMKMWLTYPGVQTWWHGKPSPFSTSFSAAVEDCIAAGYQPERPGAWEQWLRAGTAAQAEP